MSRKNSWAFPRILTRAFSAAYVAWVSGTHLLTSRFIHLRFAFCYSWTSRGRELYQWGVCVGAKDIEHMFLDFFVSLFMPDCFSSLDGEVSGRRSCTSECANPRSHERDKARGGGL